MRPRSLLRARRAWLLGAGCLIAVALIKPVQDRIDARLNRPSIDPDLLYFSSPGVVKAMSLGYDSLLADIYWMRAIQYYGRRDEADRRQIRYKNLPALLDIVTSLNPKMTEVYRAGSCFLAEPLPVGAGRPFEAIRLLEKGISCLPQEWRLRFDEGFVYFWHLKDARRAGQIWLEASRIPGAPPWMESLAARGFSQGGEMETAKDLWRRQLESSTREDLKANARNHLASIQVNEEIWTIEFFLEKFAAAHGAPPAKLELLVQPGYLSRVPDDPSGVPYAYNPATGAVSLSPDSKVRYLMLPFNYRDSFKARLAKLYGADR